MKSELPSCTCFKVIGNNLKSVVFILNILYFVHRISRDQRSETKYNAIFWNKMGKGEIFF